MRGFAWGAPDRLELSGTFVGLPDVPADAPTLVISGVDGVHRLPVVPDSLSGPPEDGRRWEAVFAWQEPPVAFEVAELEFGDDMVVELPEPAASRTRLASDAQRDRGARPEAGGRPPATQASQRRASGRTDGRSAAPRASRAARLPGGAPRAQSELQRTQEELKRVRTDLASERELRRADTERFRQGLAELRDAAAQTLEDHQRAEQRLSAELRDARGTIGAKDAVLENLGGQFEAAAAKHAEAESEAAAEIKGLRERLAGLEAAAAEADQLRAEFETSRRHADETRAQLDSARSAVEAARSDAEQLLGRLTRLGDGGGDSG